MQNLLAHMEMVGRHIDLAIVCILIDILFAAILHSKHLLSETYESKVLSSTSFECSSPLHSDKMMLE